MANKVAIHNPHEPLKTVARYAWNGTPYEIQPGETVLVDEHIAAHARKHNNHLIIMDESAGALSYAESQVKLKEEEVQRLSAELQAKTSEFKKAQGELLAARSKLKHEQAARERELKGENARE